jgi:hypothetical protein
MFVLLFDQKDYEKFDGNAEVVATIIWCRETYTFSAVLAARSCPPRPAKAVASHDLVDFVRARAGDRRTG